MRALALLDETPPQLGLALQDKDAVVQAVLADLREMHLYDDPGRPMNSGWLRQQAFVRTHADRTRMGATATLADELAGSVSHQVRERRRPFRLHDTRGAAVADGGEPRPTRGTGRAIANEQGFVSRVFVVVVSSVVCLGILQKRQTAAGTVVGNKYTRHSGLVYMFRP